MATLIGKTNQNAGAGFTRSGIPTDVFEAAKKYSDEIVAERTRLYAKMDAKDAFVRKIVKPRKKQKPACDTY
jgi:hypothetical protein